MSPRPEQVRQPVPQEAKQIEQVALLMEAERILSGITERLSAENQIAGRKNRPKLVGFLFDQDQGIHPLFTGGEYVLSAIGGEGFTQDFLASRGHDGKADMMRVRWQGNNLKEDCDYDLYQRLTVPVGATTVFAGETVKPNYTVTSRVNFFVEAESVSELLRKASCNFYCNEGIRLLRAFVSGLNQVSTKS